MSCFSDDELTRYARQMILPAIGATGQEKLRQARILVIGAGGLGAPLLLQLVAAGIGHIGLIDPDHVALSNLHRQILYRQDDIGTPKVTAAARHLEKLNEHVHITPFHQRADRVMLEEILPHYMLVCDGTDNAETRLAVSDLCVQHQKTLICGAVQGFSGQYAVFPPEEGQKETACYRCLYPDIDSTPIFGCSTAGIASMGGIIGPVTQVIAGFMAMEVLRRMIGLEGANSPATLTLWDGLAATLRSFSIPYNPCCTAPHHH